MISFSTLDDECPYQKDKISRLEYMVMEGVDEKGREKNTSFLLNDELVKRGWRRFGSFFSRPVCKNCNDCLGLRINVEEFLLSKSQRRIMRKNAKTKIILQRPSLSEQHLLLYKSFHEFKKLQRGWKIYDLSFKQYYNCYVANQGEYAYELDFYVDDKLVCVDLIDMVSDGISSVYCFYDPTLMEYSLGKYSLLSEIELAKKRGLKYIYLGYYVKNCPSLAYKGLYEPYELLNYASSLDKDAILWRKEDKCK